MDIYAPEYCLDFKCIADKCRHSCCVGWEIKIDDEAYGKYKSLSSDFGIGIMQNITLSEKEHVFRLGQDKRCPNLDENGLCRIIRELGEDYLCDICRLHPRFFNRAANRIEMGIGLSCEQAVRTVLLHNKPFKLVKIGEKEESYVPELSDFCACETFSSVIEAAEREELSIEKRLELIESENEVRTAFYSEKEWIELLLSLEILDGKWRDILTSALKSEAINGIVEYEKYIEQLFKYFAFRHIPTASSESNLKARVGFAVLSTRLIIYLAVREKNLTRDSFFDIIRLYSSEIEYCEENTDTLIFEIEAENF